MHDLNDMRLFAGVANTGSFTAAAERLGIPKSTLSRRLSALEQALGVRLLERTTRRVRVTEAGALYLNYCERIEAEAEQAEVAVNALLEAPRGILRVSAALDVGQGLLAPALADFLSRYRDVRLTCVYTNRRVNLIEEGYDLALRIGRLEDASLVAKPLGQTAPKLFASRAYLASRSAPRRTQDLRKHALLTMSDSAKNNRWTLVRRGKSVTLPIEPVATVNDFISLRELAARGAGIALLPPYLCGDDSLCELMPAWSAPAAPVTALYPSHRGATPKLRALLDFLSETLSPKLEPLTP